MKNVALLILLLCATAMAGDPELMQIGELPGQKTPELIQPKDRNPFMRRETKVAVETADKESEESRLRDLFKTLPITGIIRGGGDVKVLLSNLILKQGELLPPLIESQTEVLIVAAITDNEVEIDFVESNEHAEPRKILIPIDLTPRVAISPVGVAPASQPSDADHSQADPRPPVQ
ncbi:MAG: hypothetical protein ACREKL_04035 [Chthoniobacterales bacterium]